MPSAPDAELLYLARYASRYPPAVGAAAVAELRRRGLLPEAALPLPPPAAAEPQPEEPPKPGGRCCVRRCGACFGPRASPGPCRCSLTSTCWCGWP
ncbi:MAG: hypothetical protein WKG07_12835 [Hymenobacter sp.]